MRMWMVNPKIMCRNHLLGEHLELHMFKSSILQGKDLRGYIRNNLLEPESIIKRHHELVLEMLKRGYNHLTPLNVLRFHHIFGIKNYRYKIDKKLALQDLLKRCKECRKNYRRIKK